MSNQNLKLAAVTLLLLAAVSAKGENHNLNAKGVPQNDKDWITWCQTDVNHDGNLMSKSDCEEMNRDFHANDKPKTKVTAPVKVDKGNVDACLKANPHLSTKACTEVEEDVESGKIKTIDPEDMPGLLESCPNLPKGRALDACLKQANDEMQREEAKFEDQSEES